MKRKEYSEVINAALQLIIDGQMSSLALDKVLAEKEYVVLLTSKIKHLMYYWIMLI